MNTAVGNSIGCFALTLLSGGWREFCDEKGLVFLHDPVISVNCSCRLGSNLLPLTQPDRTAGDRIETFPGCLLCTAQQQRCLLQQKRRSGCSLLTSRLLWFRQHCLVEHVCRDVQKLSGCICTGFVLFCGRTPCSSDLEQTDRKPLVATVDLRKQVESSVIVGMTPMCAS